LFHTRRPLVGLLLNFHDVVYTIIEISRDFPISAQKFCEYFELEKYNRYEIWDLHAS
jgi:hypothetical protein